MAEELPVWVCGQRLWLKGVDTKTTCNDIIFALMGRVDEGYVIIERWRGVEKPLGGLVRVWKLWSQWGDTQHEVKLTLKKVTEEPPQQTPATSRRKHCRQKVQGQTVHPKKLCHVLRSQNIEKMLKLILVQGETIQNQLKKLHERDLQIEETIKDSTDATTSDKEKKNDSGVMTESFRGTNINSVWTLGENSPEDEMLEKDELRKKIEYWEKIVKVNKKLEKEEETLVRLYISLHRTEEKNEALITAELRRVEMEFEKIAKELENNSYNISEADICLNERRKYLRKLHLELEASDNETARLMRMGESISRYKDKNPLDFDSNSDTGLSSLHSSSEEGTYILDTIF